VRGRRLAPLIAVTASSLGLISALAGSAAAGTARPSLSAHATQPTAVQTGDARPAAANVDGCKVPVNTYNRTEACGTLSGWVNVYESDAGFVGSVTYLLHEAYHLNVKSRKITITLTVHTTSVTGDASGLTMTITPTCNSTCRVPKTPIVGTLGTGDGFSKTIVATDSTARMHNAFTDYAAVFTRPDTLPARYSWQFPLAVRCDNMLKTQQAAGCVFPNAVPTLTDMAGLKYISKNIRKAQTQKGSVGYGKPGGEYYLHRLTDQSEINQNRSQVCPKKAKPPKGKKGWSCDEYPFASTEEGGKALPAADRSTAWVPASEQKSQGGMLNKFNLKYRILNTDAYWVEA
jgi:Deoxyribonuclease NucA/NucB